MTNCNDGKDGSKQPGQEPSNKETTTTAPPPPPPQPRRQQEANRPQPQPPRQRQANPPPLPPPRRPRPAAGAARALPGPSGGIRLGGGGVRVGGGAEGSAGHAADISNARRPQKRKASEVRAPEGVRSICAVCNREFKSFKALFGHMRSHPNRPWRGCFPPPGFENLQPRPAPPPGGRVVRNIDLNLRPQSQSGGESSGVPQREGFDLNRRPEPQTGESSDGAEKEDFDLNKRPSPDDAHNDRN